MTETIKRTIILRTDRHSLPTKVEEFITWLTEEVNRIPEEYRKTAEFEIDEEWNYSEKYVVINISYWQPETNEEKAANEAENRKRQAETVQRELKLLEQLKQKYHE